MKMNQIAFYCATDEQALRVKRMFGLEHAPWVKDTVLANVFVHGEPGQNTAELQFNESLGIQLEIIRYIDGPHWCQSHPLSAMDTYIAHVGLHLDPEEVWPEMPGCKLVQEAYTIRHSAALQSVTGRRYAYRIYEAAPGSYIKHIRRIET